MNHLNSTCKQILTRTAQHGVFYAPMLSLWLSYVPGDFSTHTVTTLQISNLKFGLIKMKIYSRFNPCNIWSILKIHKNHSLYIWNYLEIYPFFCFNSDGLSRGRSCNDELLVLDPFVSFNADLRPPWCSDFSLRLHTLSTTQRTVWNFSATPLAITLSRQCIDLFFKQAKNLCCTHTHWFSNLSL